MLELSTTHLPPSVMGKLCAKAKIKSKEFNIIVRQMAGQLRDKFKSPGSEGATAQWCFKMVTLYPSLADEGTTLFAKTVNS